MNVLKVADELQAMGVDLSKAEVIVIVKEYQKRVGIPMDGHLVPSNAISRASQWLHHVVLKVDGKIYDLEAGAEGLAPREYLARMFPDRPEQVGRADKIKVRVLGLAEYRELTGPFNYGDSIRLLTSYTDTPDFPHTLRPYSQIIDGPTGNP